MLGKLSLATKCLLLFGAALVLIIAAALAVPWFRMNAMAEDAQVETVRQMARVWESSLRRGAVEHEPLIGEHPRAGPLLPGQRAILGETTILLVLPGEPGTRFSGEAMRTLLSDPRQGEHLVARWTLSTRQYDYARALRTPDGMIEGLIVLSRSSPQAARAAIVNTVFLLSAGCLALGLAVLVFYLITNRIILFPVRRLRETAEQVRSGNLDVRSDISTNDEFAELAETFNAMLEAIQAGQNQLRAINSSLDQKVGELSDRNDTLYQAAKLKGEFLANVTHELRTPLNSILGFAELLDEQIGRERESEGDSPKLAKRSRYIDNILSASRSLLDLINGLLEMAKVDAGKAELTVIPLRVREACEGMAAMMKPVADKRAVELVLDLGTLTESDTIHTDSKKLQQILFNLLSNAIKFTAYAQETDSEGRALAEVAHAEHGTGGYVPPEPRRALVTVRAERLPPRGSEQGGYYRISVLDTGPGIAPQDQTRIFEKFTQLDAGASRKHSGTGLGLAICKELTGLLQGEIQVQSEPGRGSMFSVILPERLDPTRAAESKLELSFRGALAGQ